MPIGNAPDKLTYMTSTQNLRPGQEVTFTQFGRKGVRTDILNGYSVLDAPYRVVANIRTQLGVVSVPVDRVSAA